MPERHEEEKAPEHGGKTDPMEMGMGMARKMMAQMGKGGPSPMAMMQKMMAEMAHDQEGGAQMPPMMQMCMGMCSEMLTAIKRTSDMATFATPELHHLFADWLATLEGEALRHLRQSGETDTAGIAKALSVSEESAAFLIAHMTSSGKAQSKVWASETGEAQ